MSLCPGYELYPFEARGWFHTFEHKIIINSHAILFIPASPRIYEYIDKTRNGAHRRRRQRGPTATGGVAPAVRRDPRAPASRRRLRLPPDIARMSAARAHTIHSQETHRTLCTQPAVGPAPVLSGHVAGTVTSPGRCAAWRWAGPWHRRRQERLAELARHMPKLTPKPGADLMQSPPSSSGFWR